jgi:hypothetical protein
LQIHQENIRLKFGTKGNGFRGRRCLLNALEFWLISQKRLKPLAMYRSDLSSPNSGEADANNRLS